MATKSKSGKAGGKGKKSIAPLKQSSVTGAQSSAGKKGGTKKAPKLGLFGGAAKPKFVPAGTDPEQENLSKIEHIVVVVMENRSFDHMLGYLKLEGGRDDIDGLADGMSNTHAGKTYPVHHLDKTALEEGQDPCHDAECVTEQLSGDNGGFVSNYAKTHPNDPDPGLVMGYFNGANLPVYDHLACEFAVCDHWFCSVDGATWPNRLYLVTGRADGKKVNKKIPFYNLPSFVRHLDAQNVSWRWYCHDVATLRVTDAEYRVGSFSHFAYFDRRTLLSRKSFLDDAASGNLASVSWIDPNFVDVGFVGPSGSNDDHPPSDVLAGQEFILKLYNAVINGPQWEKTMLVIVYDEHGGFYDHVPTQTAADDNPKFRTYGVRVPAIVVSPWVDRGKASSTVFDHTSIIKTVLLRFCKRADGTIPDMGARVNNANHLGTLLTQNSPRKAPPASAYQHAVEIITQWKSKQFKTKLKMQGFGIAPPVAELNELQEGVIAAKRRLRAEGLPEGQP
jgi:phospholipase C